MKCLLIVANNCSGQNKNNCVIKLCVWFVEASWCGEVVLMFLVKDHTTNECDSKFNSFKEGTRGVNIFTERGLDAAYTRDNKEDTIHHHTLSADNRWQGFTKGLANPFSNVESGHLKKNHIFSFGGNNSSKKSVTRQLYRDEKKVSYDLKIKDNSKQALLIPYERSQHV